MARFPRGSPGSRLGSSWVELGNMQSILQYRNFGRRVQEQFERDPKHTEALEHGNADDESSSALIEVKTHRRSSIDISSSLDSRDLEKAEQPGGSSLNQADGDDGGQNETGELERGETANTLNQTQSFGTRMGHALRGIEVRQLSK